MVGCAGLDGERRPPSGERMEEKGAAPSDVVLPSLLVCLLGSKRSEDKEMVTVEVYDTTTLTLTVPSDVMRRRSMLLDVLLVDVISEELCPKLDWGKAVAELSKKPVSEEFCEKIEFVGGPPLPELPGADNGVLPTFAPVETSVF